MGIDSHIGRDIGRDRGRDIGRGVGRGVGRDIGRGVGRGVDGGGKTGELPFPPPIYRFKMVTDRFWILLWT